MPARPQAQAFARRKMNQSHEVIGHTLASAQQRDEEYTVVLLSEFEVFKGDFGLASGNATKGVWMAWDLSFCFWLGFM